MPPQQLRSLSNRRAWGRSIEMNRSDEYSYASRMSGALVTGVFAFREQILSDGTISAEEIIIECGNIYLRIYVDNNTDEISTSDEVSPELYRQLTPLDCMSVFVGKEFGWSWVARNINGFQDCVLFSFSVLSPDVCIIAMASSLSVYFISKSNGD